jgi:hypothetical protein
MPVDATAAAWCDGCDAAAEAVHRTNFGRHVMSNYRKIVGCLLVAAAVTGGVLISSNTRGQDKPDQKAPDQKAPDQKTPEQKPDEKAMADALQKSMTPGKEHEALAKQVGSWKVEMVDHSMGENKSEASAEIKMLMGGRYQEITVKGTMMGQPFEGCSTTGFDNMRKVYVNTWIDSMGTSITTAEGKAVDDKTIEMKGKMADPTGGNMLDFRNIQKNIDDDHFTLDMYFTVHGQEQKMMTVNYSRVK